MESRVEVGGRISEEGGLRVNSDEKPLLLSVLSEWRGKEITLEVRLNRRRRSGQQNSYYWKVVVGLVRKALMEEHGEMYTKDEVHGILKQQCNWREITNEESGESIKIPKSTRDLNTLEFEEYEERCRRFAAEFLGVDIPLPNENTDADLEV